jgi:hypothetical protein
MLHRTSSCVVANMNMTSDFCNYNYEECQKNLIKQFWPLNQVVYIWYKIYFQPMLCGHMAIENVFTKCHMSSLA